MKPFLMTIAAAAAIAATSTATAAARPPQQARITLGSGMGGATLGQVTTELTPSGTIGPAPFTAWGRVMGGFCFEGSECAWNVPGGGVVGISRHPTGLQVLLLSVSARGWRTSKDVGPGTSSTTLRRRYTSAVRIATCVGPFGGLLRGYRVGSHNLFTTKDGKVERVYVSQAKIVPKRPSQC